MVSCSYWVLNCCYSHLPPGELLQIIFLFTRCDDDLVDVYDLPMNLVWGYSSALVLGYIIFMILQVVVSTVTYSQFHGF